jgi:hypothetical protein
MWLTDLPQADGSNDEDSGGAEEKAQLANVRRD